MFGKKRHAASLDTPYLGHLDSLPSRLIFIMGCHRSGTSMLYHLLALTRQLDYVTAYDVIKYHELLHNRITGQEERVKADLQQVLQRERSRGLDDLPVGTDLPEEYHFLMHKDGPRVIFNFRKRIDEAFFSPDLTPESLDEFVRMCQKKRFLAGEDRPLVLKNPSDYYFNFWAVHEMLPRAKFIFIHRHPLPMFNSYLHGFSGVLEQRSNYAALLNKEYEALFDGPSFQRKMLVAVFRSNKMARLLLSRLVDSFNYYMTYVSRLPSDRYVSVRYEDVCADPVRSLAHIGERLDLDLIPRVPPKFVAPRHIPIRDRVKKHYADRVPDMAAYLQHCQYEPWPE